MNSPKDSLPLLRRSIVSRFQEIGLQALLAGIISASLLAFPLDFLEAPLFDLRQRFSAKIQADTQIAIVTIDEETLNQTNREFPLGLEYHQRALDQLQQHQLKGIGYLVDFNKVEVMDSESFRDGAAEQFVRSATQFNAQGTPLILGIPFDVSGEVSPPFPISQIPHAVSRVHKDGVTFGKDNVTRRALVSVYDRLTFEMTLAARLQDRNDITNPPGTYSSKDHDTEYFYFRLHQTDGLLYDTQYETFAYPRYSFVDLIEGRIPPGTLDGKIVLVGSYQREDPNDFAMVTKTDRSGWIPNVLVQANILDSILNQQGLKTIPTPITAIICFILSFVVIFASLKIRPSHLILVTVGLIIGTLAVSFLLFQPIPILGSNLIHTSRPLVALVLSFYLMIPLRLTSENRQRFALEKQNRMLKEVEELKTNFLQLVTHDLKTPIARIQGLCESLKRSLQDRIQTKDQEIFQNVFLAIEELNHFISSLLELSKLDNQEIRVQLQSKDINLILENIVLKHRFESQARQIQIITDFETLFPIRIDPALITKVMSNLLDNAIKYSPDQTTIKIQTREVNGFVEIKIKDQGIGIPESELQNLFSRFFRVKNDLTQKVKGSGLGLYLSKYFIEAHRGTISIVSQVGIGTEFSILLPIELDLAIPLNPNESQEKAHA